jgi:hypothetical protein
MTAVDHAKLHLQQTNAEWCFILELSVISKAATTNLEILPTKTKNSSLTQNFVICMDNDLVISVLK